MEETNWNPITLVTEIADDELALDAGELRGVFTVLTGSQAGKLFTLGDTNLLGRARDANVLLEDDGVSRLHARIVRVGKEYEIVDLESRNGTFVDGQRIKDQVRLSNGARVRVANVVMKFSMQDTIEAEASRRMYELSVRDGLTGVNNRRYFEERMTGELAYAMRHHAALCVILLDIDHFKRINDTYGHPAGDFVLRRVATALQGAVRAEDLLARFGGEEFAVLARGIDVAGARMLGERLRAVVAGLDVIVDGQRVRVTVSAGIAHNHTGGAAHTEAGFVAAADGALYNAKRAGRNRVTFAVSAGQYSGVEPNAKDATRKRVWDKATAPSLEIDEPGHGRGPKSDPRMS